MNDSCYRRGYTKARPADMIACRHISGEGEVLAEFLHGFQERGEEMTAQIFIVFYKIDDSVQSLLMRYPILNQSRTICPASAPLLLACPCSQKTFFRSSLALDNVMVIEIVNSNTLQH